MLNEVAKSVLVFWYIDFFFCDSQQERNMEQKGFIYLFAMRKKKRHFKFAAKKKKIFFLNHFHIEKKTHTHTYKKKKPFDFFCYFNLRGFFFVILIYRVSLHSHLCCHCPWYANRIGDFQQAFVLFCFVFFWVFFLFK